jgi:hypothetical protein
LPQKGEKIPIKVACVRQRTSCVQTIASVGVAKHLSRIGYVYTGKNPKIPMLVNTWYYINTNYKPTNSQFRKYLIQEKY